MASTGYGYSLFFRSRSFGKRNVARPERFWCADRIRGCADRERIVSGVFQLVLFTRFFRFSLFIEAAALVAMIAVVPKDTLLELGNSRFEQYPELLKIDWVDVLFSGREKKSSTSTNSTMVFLHNH